MPNFETLRAHLRDPMAIGALIVGLAPLLGVGLWGWSLGALVVLYWAENVLIGVVNAARMLAAGAAQGVTTLVGAVFMTAFFIVHYGGFCFVHGMFVFAFFGGLQEGEALEPRLEAVFGMGLTFLGVLALIAAWKLVEFVALFVGRGEMRRAKLDALMMAPYGRIVFLHLAIFAAAFALTSVGEPVWGVAILAVLKAAFDLVMDANRAAKSAPVTTERTG